ncbi:hypothetical protein NKG05_15740 [Oerskovia sp. M15]
MPIRLVSSSQKISSDSRRLPCWSARRPSGSTSRRGRTRSSSPSGMSPAQPGVPGGSGCT